MHAGNIAILGNQDSGGDIIQAPQLHPGFVNAFLFGVILCSHHARKTPTGWALEARKTPWLQNKELLQPQSPGFLRVNVVFIQHCDLALQPNPS